MERAFVVLMQCRRASLQNRVAALKTDFASMRRHCLDRKLTSHHCKRHSEH